MPSLPASRGKFGQEVASQLGVTSVAQLAAYSRAELVRRFGEQQGAFLAGLPLAQVGSVVLCRAGRVDWRGANPTESCVQLGGSDWPCASRARAPGYLTARRAQLPAGRPC